VLLQGVFASPTSVRGAYFNRHRQCSSRFGHTRIAGTAWVRCTLGGVAVRRAPEPGPVRGDRGKLSDLFCTLPRRPFTGRGGEVSATPIDRVADCGFLIELLSGDSSGRPCPAR
jgi:hypothetical protein